MFNPTVKHGAETDLVWIIEKKAGFEMTSRKPDSRRAR
jgi:hypothetical protein